jgi:hypothetical protein
MLTPFDTPLFIMKNYTIQPNEIFYLNISPESKIIVLYLNSRSDSWIIYKSQIQSMFDLSDKKIDKCWKQLQQLGLITKHRTFNRLEPYKNVTWTFNKNTLTALCANGKNAASKNTNGKDANGVFAASKIAALPNTDVPPITDVQQLRMDRKYVTTLPMDEIQKALNK